MEPMTITVAKGDGIGEEIMNAALRIMEAAGAPLQYEEIKVGEDVYLSGVKSGIPDNAWDVMARNKVLLKGPITTPRGGGYKSLNVTIRKTMNLFANVRPVMSFYPFVKTNFPNMDIVVVRENEEDLYAGIEHQQTPEVVQTLKLITRPGCERIIRYAFEYALTYGRKKVTCMTKDNIMKHTDGLFHKVFEEIKEDYPEIESNHYIIDIGSARIANSPEQFDVIVTLNLYGDIISDITAEITGSVGLGGSANIGKNFAMFEAIHGSAPDIAGRGIANPSGLINASCMMLVHVGLAEYAERVQNALFKTFEDGIHTGDMKGEHTKEVVGTEDFTNAVIARLGQQPSNLRIPHYSNHQIKIEDKETPRGSKKLVGVDVFLDWIGEDRNPDVIGRLLEKHAGDRLKLQLITNRGVKVYPHGRPETFCSDHWRCRFVSVNTSSVEHPEKVEYTDIIGLLTNLEAAGLNFIKMENLYEFDGVRGYSLAQGQ